MLRIVGSDARPEQYGSFIRERFAFREVLKGTPLTAQPGAAMMFEPGIADAPDAVQDRRACCGTLNHPEYFDLESVLEEERQALAAWCRDYGGARRDGRNGDARPTGGNGAVQGRHEQS